MQARTRFNHDSLEHDISSIRTVRILSETSPDGLIQCEISSTVLSDEYSSHACLSYMWGPLEDPTFEILINGKTFRVRKNLWDFLQLARPKYADQPYWIDALCIDQTDTAERNHQVQQMGQIFLQAVHVTIWLGKHPTMGLVLAALGGSALDVSFDAWTLIRKNEEGIRNTIFFNEYWRRAWVTQEVVLARSAKVLLDTEEITFAELASASRNFYLRNCEQSPFTRFSGIVSDQELRGQSLIYLLLHFRDRLCSIPRDGVFSLLSLCSETLDVEYELSDAHLMYRILDACKDRLCLCSAALIAETLKLPSNFDKLDTVVDQDSFQPYIEFDIRCSSSVIGKPWCALYGNTSPFTWPDTGRMFDLHNCCDKTRISLLWEDPSYGKTNGPVFCRVSEGGQVVDDKTLIRVCDYGRGFLAHRKGSVRGSNTVTIGKVGPVLQPGEMIDVYTVRISLAVYARVFQVPVQLCVYVEYGKDMNSTPSLFERPRIGYGPLSDLSTVQEGF